MISELQITGMYNGVSTQPSHLRYPTQCADLVNGVPDLVSGVRKRRPFATSTQIVIGNGTIGNPLIVPSFTILDSTVWRTNDNKRFLAIVYKARYEYISTGTTYGAVNLRLYDIDNDTWYLPETDENFADNLLGTTTPDMNTDYRVQLLPIGNTLYILNKDKVILGAPTFLTDPVVAFNEDYFDRDLYGLQSIPEFNQDSKYAFVHIRDGANGVTYNVKATASSYYSGEGTVTTSFTASYASNTNSSAICALNTVYNIRTALVAAGDESRFRVGLVEEDMYWDGTNWRQRSDDSIIASPTFYSCVIFIENLGDGPISLEVSYSDSQGGVYGTSFTSTVNYIEELPLNMWEGTYFKVANTSSEFDDYFVVFSEGRWQEFVYLEDDHIGIDETTMPSKLTYDGASFTLGYETWSPRRAGSEDTNPLPTFIDNSIESMFIWQNRLGFVSGENIILSESDGLTNFFATSSKVSTDADPIDIQQAVAYTDKLLYAIPFQSDLLLTSNTAQYRLFSSNGALSKSTLQSRQTTNISLYNRTKPIRNGRFVLFLEDNNGYPRAIHYLSGGSDSDDYTEPLTTHANGYLQDTDYIKRQDNWYLTAVDNTYIMATNNVIYGLTEEVKGREKVQQAVFKWEYEGASQTSMWLTVDNTLYGFALTGDWFNTISVYSVSLDENLTDSEELIGYLDFQTDATTVTVGDITYIQRTTGTAFNMLYQPLTGIYYHCDGDVSSVVTTDTPFSTYTGIVCGYSYGFTYEFNPPVIKNRLGVPTTSGDTRYRAMGITGETSETQIKLEYGSRETTTYIPLGRQRAQRFGEVSSFSGFCSTILRGDARDTRVSLYDNSPYGCRFESAVFELEHFKRARQF